MRHDVVDEGDDDDGVVDVKARGGLLGAASYSWCLYGCGGVVGESATS